LQYTSDYFEDFLVIVYEFSQTNEINEYDQKLLDGQFHLLQAKEYGLGLFVDDENGTLYLVPCSICKLNESLQFHSEVGPAIEWKEGFKMFYLLGVHLEKKLYEQIMDKTLPAKDALKIENQDQRTVAIQYLGGEKILKELGGKKFAKDKYGELWRLEEKDTNGNPYVYYRGPDPSKNNALTYVRVPPTMKTPQESQTYAYRTMRWGLSYNPILRT
jgi:hypothetical protein